MTTDSFGSRATLAVGERRYVIHRLDVLERAGLPIASLPCSLEFVGIDSTKRFQIVLHLQQLRVDFVKVTFERVAFLAARVQVTVNAKNFR